MPLQVEITKLAYSYQNAINHDLSQLIAQPSWEDQKSSTKEMPFGRGIACVFQIMKELCVRENLTISSVGNYAFHAEFGLDPKIAMACHLDTVPIDEKEQWISPPLQLSERDGYWYGLGVNDNKGAAILSLYALKIIQQLSPQTKVRLIFGGAEETSWLCMKEYLKVFPSPEFVIVPDGNFPLVSIEKGVIYFTLTSQCFEITDLQTSNNLSYCCDYVSVQIGDQHKEWTSAKTSRRHPYRNKNAISQWAETMPQKGIWKLLNLLGDGTGEALDIACTNQDISKNHSNTFSLNEARLKENKLIVTGDIRYMEDQDRLRILEYFKNYCDENSLLFNIVEEKRLINESLNNEVIKILYQTYQAVSNDTKSQALTMGAQSYARVFKKAIAYGPCFPNHDSRSHKANENMPIEDMIKALIIYTNSLILLSEYYDLGGTTHG